MIINFSVSNFLSFNNQQTLSMEAGKARRYASRLYKNRSLRVLKFMSFFGGNAVGKSNLLEAINFMRNMVIEGLPRGFSNKYFREAPSNKDKNSNFKITILLNDRVYEYGFSILLRKGSVKKEFLNKIQVNGVKKCIFLRNIEEGIFTTGEFVKTKKAREKLSGYGEDSLMNDDCLFLNIMNNGKNALYREKSELNIFKDLYEWFMYDLTINRSNALLSERPLYTDSNIKEIGNYLKALGLGITDFKYFDVSLNQVRNVIPEEIIQDIVGNLEKQNVTNKHENGFILRSKKDFYIFELDNENRIRIRTIAFQHEKENVYFMLNEESDGTARIFDLIEILLSNSENSVFVIDEIDHGLHPIMTVKLIEAFLALSEIRNTQLIVTTHESRLLDDELLRSDEVNFIVKNDEGESLIKSLEDFNIRSDKKVLSALFDGTLDEVNPKIDYEKLLIDVTKNNMK